MKKEYQLNHFAEQKQEYILCACIWFKDGKKHDGGSGAFNKKTGQA